MRYFIDVGKQKNISKGIEQIFDSIILDMVAWVGE